MASSRCPSRHSRKGCHSGSDHSPATPGTRASRSSPTRRNSRRTASSPVRHQGRSSRRSPARSPARARRDHGRPGTTQPGTQVTVTVTATATVQATANAQGEATQISADGVYVESAQRDRVLDVGHKPEPAWPALACAEDGSEP